ADRRARLDERAGNQGAGPEQRAAVAVAEPRIDLVEVECRLDLLRCQQAQRPLLVAVERDGRRLALDLAQAVVELASEALACVEAVEGDAVGKDAVGDARLATQHLRLELTLGAGGRGGADAGGPAERHRAQGAR